MGVRLYIGVCFFRLFAAGAAGAATQESHLTSTSQSEPLQNVPSGAVIERIEFTGLRRIPPDAVKSRIASREAQACEAECIARDLHVLNRLGWFEDVIVEAIEVRQDSTAPAGARPFVRIVFHVKEYPFLSEAEYVGSKVLSAQEIRKLLEHKKLTPQIGVRANPVLLHRAAKAIESELHAMGHPDAKVAVAREELPGGRLKAEFQIQDGPRLSVKQVVFSGDPEIPDPTLRKQMRRVAPAAWLSGIRNKNIFTSERVEEDRESLLDYFQNHGFPEARIGSPRATRVEVLARSMLPWPRSRREPGLQLTLPVEAGPSYEFSSIQVGDGLRQKLATTTKREPQLPQTQAGRPFSAQAAESLRRAWELQIHRGLQGKDGYHDCRVRATLVFDASAHSASVRLDLDQDPPYVIRRVEFRGNHRFADRYLRHRVGVKEGSIFDEHRLEAGLARLARTTYFRPIQKEDVQIESDEAGRTADLTVHLQEIGRQNVAFSGGREQFGTALGLAYTVFNVLKLDELLSAQIDGGPATFQMALGFAKEGFLGSRGAIALSIFHAVLRPRLAESAQGPFLRTQTQGVNVGWTYPISNIDAFGIDYGLSRSVTEYSLTLPASVTGVTASTLRSESSIRSVGISWTRHASDQKISAATAVSGGWLGGKENLLRSRVEYSRIFGDPVFDHNNTWAFRTTAAAAGSYAGGMPIYARLFTATELVRGLRPGELGPYATQATISSSGTAKYSAVPAGANLIAASNLEYRHPLPHGTEAAGFVDTGSGLLLPNWLGSTRPLLIYATNGLIHASTGLEVRWTLPVLQVPLRINYSFNILRLDRSCLMPDGSHSRVRNRFGLLGWAVGPLF
jgi:outer membrane protein assembly complex protein YaeT